MGETTHGPDGQRLTPARATTVVIDYTNHRGERRERRIVPAGIRFGATDWHPEPQWLLEAHDCERGAARSFALRDVHAWRPLREPRAPVPGVDPHIPDAGGARGESHVGAGVPNAPAEDR